MCHVYEHVDKPEEFILEAMSKLKKGGVFSIALPTDPVFFGEWVGCSVKSFVKKKQNISIKKYDYINALDHVNSIFFV